MLKPPLAPVLKPTQEAVKATYTSQKQLTWDLTCPGKHIGYILVSRGGGGANVSYTKTGFKVTYSAPKHLTPKT